MKQHYCLFALGLIASCLTAGHTYADTTTKILVPVTKASVSANESLVPNFPDFGYMPSPGEHQGRIFKLSQNFPKTKPPLDPAVKRILKIDFKKDWNAYMLAVRDYVYEGNIENRPASDAFNLEDNKVRPWFHVPWQHSGPFGREGIHGLTKEGPVMPKSLAPLQTDRWQTYAVGFYNQQGGWTIGRVWANPNNPSLDSLKKEGFPEGTIVGKMLFTTAPVSQVPFLSSPVEWSAYATKCFAPPKAGEKPTEPNFGINCDKTREMTTVRFIQMDIMVRDSRAKETGGWVFGTFVFNGNLANPNMWKNVVPVGLQWGNDPTVTSDSESNPTPVVTKINPDLKQSVINQSTDMPPMHLGWGGRLNGPVDNTKSACMSCHSTAQFPRVSPIMPSMEIENGKNLTPADKKWMKWFRNVKCNTSFDQQAVSTDYSLQLAASIQNFLTQKALEAGGMPDGGKYNVQYWNGLPIPSILGARGSE